jgi:hypothetical protein
MIVTYGKNPIAITLFSLIAKKQKMCINKGKSLVGLAAGANPIKQILS